MISIVSPDDAPILANALSEETRSLHFTFLARGTAKSNVMEYFGLSGAEKNIVVSVIPESMERRLLSVAVNSLKLYLVGKGIAFTVPLTALSSLIADAVVADKVPAKGGGKMPTKMPTANKYDLIAVVYRQELSDAVLEATRSAGAVGGTLVHARTLSSAGVEQFVGVTLGAETEILLILTKRELRNDIMKAAQSVAGLKTDGSGVVFSMPVDALVGIGTTSDEYREKTEEE